MSNQFAKRSCTKKLKEQQQADQMKDTTNTNTEEKPKPKPKPKQQFFIDKGLQEQM